MSAGEAKSSGPFSTRLMVALIAAGIVAFAIFMLLMAYAGDFRSGRDGRPHALSVSAVGFKGIVRLVDLAGQLGTSGSWTPYDGASAPTWLACLPPASAVPPALR